MDFIFYPEDPNSSTSRQSQGVKVIDTVIIVCSKATHFMNLYANKRMRSVSVRTSSLLRLYLQKKFFHIMVAIT